MDGESSENGSAVGYFGDCLVDSGIHPTQSATATPEYVCVIEHIFFMLIEVN